MSLREFRATSNRVLRTEHRTSLRGFIRAHRRDPTQRSVVMIGLFGVGNFGNEASLAAALGAARRVLPTAHLTTICPNPARVEREHGVSGVSINPSSRWARFAEGSRLRRLATAPLRELARWGFAVRHLRRVDLMVVPGTGILDDLGHGPEPRAPSDSAVVSRRSDDGNATRVLEHRRRSHCPPCESATDAGPALRRRISARTGTRARVDSWRRSVARPLTTRCGPISSSRSSGGPPNRGSTLRFESGLPSGS